MEIYESKNETEALYYYSLCNLTYTIDEGSQEYLEFLISF